MLLEDSELAGVRMPGRSGPLAVDPGCHVVQFYGDDRELAVGVGSYLGQGLLAGERAVVVATAEHRVAFEAELADAGIDLRGAIGSGRLVMLDAAQTRR
jgi:hypothetical protein